MGEQLVMIPKENLETKKDVFYVRCRPAIKAAVYLQMQKDGFTSMADWFDQFVSKAILPRVKKPAKKKAKKK